MHPTSTNGLTPIIGFSKLVTTLPSIVLGGKMYGIIFLCEVWMMALLATAIVFLNGPRIGSPYCFASFVVIKSPVGPAYNIPMSERAWYRKPMMCGVTCVFKVCIVDMGSLKCEMCPLEWLVVGVVWTGELVSCIQ